MHISAFFLPEVFFFGKKDVFFQLPVKGLHLCQVVCIWQSNTADENHQFLQGLDTASNLFRKWVCKEVTAAIILLDLVKTSPEEVGGHAGNCLMSLLGE